MTGVTLVLWVIQFVQLKQPDHFFATWMYAVGVVWFVSQLVQLSGSSHVIGKLHGILLSSLVGLGIGGMLILKFMPHLNPDYLGLTGYFLWMFWPVILAEVLIDYVNPAPKAEEESLS